MQKKQSYIYAAVSAIIGLGMIFLVNVYQTETITTERYEGDLNQLTAKIDSLSNTINTLTKMTLKLDKSFKENTLSEKRA